MHIFFSQQITCKDESLLLFSNDPEEMKSWTNELDSAIRFNPDVFILVEYLYMYFINLNLHCILEVFLRGQISIKSYKNMK